LLRNCQTLCYHLIEQFYLKLNSDLEMIFPDPDPAKIFVDPAGPGFTTLLLHSDSLYIALFQISPNLPWDKICFYLIQYFCTRAFIMRCC
jgi:hypothetical protein